jgi:hypothetical protein
METHSLRSWHRFRCDAVGHRRRAWARGAEGSRAPSAPLTETCAAVRAWARAAWAGVAWGGRVPACGEGPADGLGMRRAVRSPASPALLLPMPPPRRTPRAVPHALRISFPRVPVMGASQCGNDRPGFGLPSITPGIAGYNYKTDLGF